jgi:molybdopterin/thiamine biosynthesis adenylyltransferase
MSIINSCLLVGCGGIGQFLIPAAVKLLQYHPKGTLDITIMDGDNYTPKNYVRQYVTKVNDNKAEAIGKQLASKNVKIIPKYLDRSNITNILSSLIQPILIVPCVDNMATRYLILRELEKIDIKSYYWLCPGNSYDTYQVSFFRKLEGERDLYAHPFDRYSNLAQPDDYMPNSCIEEVESSPQLLSANINAAAITLSYLTNILDNIPLPQEVYGDVRKLVTQPIGKSIEQTT